MNNANTAIAESYRNNFLKEVEANVEEGEWVKMCMQCGVCSGSCPFGPYWDHPPQKIFMLIRAGRRDEVLNSTSMWMCTSCYNCIVRCPRGLPITHIMHGLAHYALRLGLAPKEQPTRKFALIFWENSVKDGRANESMISVKGYFMNGFVEGIKMCLKMLPTAISLIKTKRFNPMGMISHKGCSGKNDIHKILKKASELELARAK